MINLPTKAIVIPTHTTPASDAELPAVQYFDIVYYQDTGFSVLFHSMATTIPLNELEAHLEQIDALKVTLEMHVPLKNESKAIKSLRQEAVAEFQKIQAVVPQGRQ